MECLLRDYTHKTIESSTSTFADEVVVVGVDGQPHSSVVEGSKDQATKMAKSKTTPKTETETKASNSKKKQEMQAASLAVEMKMENLTPAARGTTPMTTTTTVTKTAAPSTRAQVNEAELQCLPKNCILQKVLHLQLLVKVSCK